MVERRVGRTDEGTGERYRRGGVRGCLMVASMGGRMDISWVVRLGDAMVKASVSMRDGMMVCEMDDAWESLLVKALVQSLESLWVQLSVRLMDGR